MSANLPRLAAEWRRLRAVLLAEFPELEEDGDLLVDTLDGEAAALDAVEGLVRAALKDEAMAQAVASIAKANQERRQRLEHRAGRRREAAYELMAACDVRKMERAEFTVSVRAVPPRVQIIDRYLIPDAFCQIEKKPDLGAIREALKSGATVAGAALGNGSEAISVRVK